MFKLSIVTPEKIFFEGEISSLIAPGIEGHLGILSNHAPLITAIVPGKATIKDGDNHEMEVAVAHGFLEVSKNQATLLTDSAEKITDIDLERAKSSYERAMKRLKEAGVDFQRAEMALQRAKNRIRLFGSGSEE